MDGRQTNAEVQGLAYAFEDTSEMIDFSYSLGSAFEKESTTVYLEGLNLEILESDWARSAYSKGTVIREYCSQVLHSVGHGSNRGGSAVSLGKELPHPTKYLQTSAAIKYLAIHAPEK